MAFSRRLPKIGGGCCAGVVGCLNCSPCQIPKRSLNYAYTGVAPLSPTSGSGTLVYGAGVLWTSATFAGSHVMTAECNAGVFVPALDGGSYFPLSSIYTSTCSPLSIVYNVPNPSAAYTAGFRTITISDPGAPANPCPCSFTTIHVKGCNGVGLSGASVVVKDATGTTVASGTTDGSGNYTPSVAGGPYSVEVSKSRFDNHTFTSVFLCNNVTQNFDVSPYVASGYVCLLGTGCPDPAKTTLTATHSVFGATTATYAAGSHAWTFNWVYAYPGLGACTAQNVNLSMVIGNAVTFGPTGAFGWLTCLAADVCWVPGNACQPATAFNQGCPVSDTCGSGTCADSVSPSLSSLTCPPSFSATYNITYTIAANSCQSKMYSGVTGSQTFTLTLTE